MGAQPSFEYLYRNYRQPLLALIGRYIRCTSEREDVLQDVFIRVHSALPNFRGESSHYTWLYRITVNTALNHLRRQSTRLTKALQCEDWELDTVDPNSPEALAMAQELETQIAQVMRQLDWVNKDAFLLYSRIGLTYDAIAQLLDCPVGTVRSRISRTRINLHQSMSTA
jgi:RNA polymerase sigma-70 factor (ECF subfamily)